jgi:hypothetical protein
MKDTSAAFETWWHNGDPREGKWRGNWRMEWAARTLTLTRHVVYPALLPLMRTPRLPTVGWTDTPADLNGLVRFGQRRNLVSSRVSPRFKRSLLPGLCPISSASILISLAGRNTTCLLSSGSFYGVWILYTNVSEHSVCSIFIGA